MILVLVLGMIFNVGGHSCVECHHDAVADGGATEQAA